jgi:hypothetical protein
VPLEQIYDVFKPFLPRIATEKIMDRQANKDLNVLKEAWLRLKCDKIARILGGLFDLFENGGLVFVL